MTQALCMLCYEETRLPGHTSLQLHYSTPQTLCSLPAKRNYVSVATHMLPVLYTDTDPISNVPHRRSWLGMKQIWDAKDGGTHEVDEDS